MMMETKHTPGPWRFYTEPQPNGCPIIGSGHGMMVAMLAHTVNQENQKDEAIANARLIAAAPELLEAARKVMAWYEAEEDHSKEPDFYKRMNMCSASEDAIRAAIAKATGA